VTAEEFELSSPTLMAAGLPAVRAGGWLGVGLGAFLMVAT